MRKDLLENFAAGGTLTPDQLCALCTDLFGGAVQYDPALDRLRSTNNAEPLPLGVPPPPLGAFPPLTGGGPPQSVQPPAPPTVRPGWAR